MIQSLNFNLSDVVSKSQCSVKRLIYGIATGKYQLYLNNTTIVKIAF